MLVLVKTMSSPPWPLARARLLLVADSCESVQSGGPADDDVVAVDATGEGLAGVPTGVVAVDVDPGADAVTVGQFDPLRPADRLFLPPRRAKITQGRRPRPTGQGSAYAMCRLCRRRRCCRAMMVRCDVGSRFGQTAVRSGRG